MKIKRLEPLFFSRGSWDFLVHSTFWSVLKLNSRTNTKSIIYNSHLIPEKRGVGVAGTTCSFYHSHTCSTKEYPRHCPLPAPVSGPCPYPILDLLGLQRGSSIYTFLAVLSAACVSLQRAWILFSSALAGEGNGGSAERGEQRRGGGPSVRRGDGVRGREGPGGKPQLQT